MPTVTEDRMSIAAGQNGGPVPRSDLSLLSLLREVYRQRRRFLKVFGIALAVGVVITLVWPPAYTATSRIMPPQQNQSSATALLGQLGSIASLATGGKDLVKNPSDLYVAMLKSRTVADHLIDRFDLRKTYRKSTYTDAREKLEDRSVIISAKDGTIAVSVEDRDPQRAAAIANAYVEELSLLNQKLAITEASQRRMFYERELVAAKDHLADAEVELKKVQEKTGVIALDEQAKVIIESVGTLRARIAAKQVQISAMSSFATAQNPDLQRAQAELEGMKTELAKLESNRMVSGRGNIQVPTGEVPSVGLEYIRKLRDVRYFEALYEILAKQFELAKLDEAKDIPLVQVLDHAVAPDERSKPNRALWITMAVFTALLCALLSVFWEPLSELALRVQTAE
jgi:tyrosine-protein kinase Etk/Wzc